MAVISELLRYLTISFFKSGLPDRIYKPAGNREVYVSLTTLPERISKIRPTIHSLLDQTLAPAKIIINVPAFSRDGTPCHVPDFLLKNNLVLVRKLKKDLGPASKLLPTLKEDGIHPEALIIVVDDDQVYPKTLIENYLNFSEEFPGHALTLCGWRIPASLNHNERNVLRAAGLRIFAPYANIKAPEQVEIIQGASSYAVSKSFFDEAVFNYNYAPEGAFFADDIWISGQLAKRKVPRTVIKPEISYCRFESFAHLRTKGLRDTANADNSNNNRLYQYFEAYWELYDSANTPR